MSDSRKPGGKHLKKEAGLKVAEVLTAALVDLKEKLGEKKFLRNIKKASKAMVAGFSDKKAIAPKKKAVSKKAPTRKTAVPKTGSPKTATRKAAPKKAAAHKS